MLSTFTNGKAYFYGLFINTLITSNPAYSAVVNWDDYVSWKTTYKSSFQKKKIKKSPGLFYLVLKTCSGSQKLPQFFFHQSKQREVITMRQNVCLEIDCTTTFILTCSFAKSGCKMDLMLFLECLCVEFVSLVWPRSAACL